MPESETATPVTEPTKPSKLDRVKTAAFTAGIAMIPIAVTVASTTLSYKTGKMQFDAAKLNLETAKLNHPTAL